MLVFLNLLMVLLISAFDDWLQLIGNRTATGCMSASCVGGCWFNTSLKCSTHLFTCFWLVFIKVFPSLSFPNLLVLLNLFFQMMLSYRPLMFCLAASFASDASLQTNYLSLILFFTSLLASVVLLFACCSLPAVVTALFESCTLINLFKVISIPGVFCFSSHHMLMLILVLPLPNCPLFCRMVHPFRTSTWNCVLLSIYLRWYPFLVFSVPHPITCSYKHLFYLFQWFPFGFRHLT